MKRFYECTFIVNPGLDDAQIESTVKMAEDTVVKNGGVLVNTENIGRRRLAYPIAKKHNGFYVCIEFEAEGRIVEKVERFLTLDENVMRYLTVTLDNRELEAKRNRAAMALQEKEAAENPSGDRKPEGERRADTERKAEADRKAEAEKKADAEKKAEADKKADADEKPEAEETKTEDANAD